MKNSILKIKASELVRILINKHAFYAMIIAITQQIFVAISTYFIVKATENISIIEELIHNLFLLLATIVLIDVISLFGPLACEKWWRKSFYTYIDCFVMVNKANPTIRNSVDAKENLVPMLCSEAEDTIAGSVSYIYDFGSVLFSIIFNIAAIVVFIDHNFMLSYIASFILSAFIIKLSSKKLTAISITAQKARLALTQHLLSGWDNIVIGNNLNYKIWHRQISICQENALLVNLNSVRLRSALSTLGSLLSKMPIFVVLFYTFHKNTDNIPIIVALMATFHRQMQILTYIEVVISYSMDFSYYIGKWKGVIGSLTEKRNNREEFAERITWKGIQIKNVHTGEVLSVKTFNDLVSILTKKTNARFEINGSNGSGKSTILLMLKDEFSSDACYLPAQHSLYFFDYKDKASTGQKTVSYLNEISLDETNILLLDEWDANLDKANTSDIDHELDVLSRIKIIIEVRHRE